MGRSQTSTVFNIHNSIEMDWLRPPRLCYSTLSQSAGTHTLSLTKDAVAVLACRGQFSSVTLLVLCCVCVCVLW